MFNLDRTEKILWSAVGVIALVVVVAQVAMALGS